MMIKLGVKGQLEVGVEAEAGVNRAIGEETEEMETEGLMIYLRG